MAVINIAQGTPCTGADGSLHNPYRARPDNATDFDDIFRLRRGANTFLVQPGIYQTQGAFAYPQNNYAMIDPNSSLIGIGGSEATSIVLAANYISTVNSQPAQQIETIIGGGSAGTGSERMQISGFRIDVNNSLLPVLGIHTFSSGSNIFDVNVVGLMGDAATLKEGFGILVNDGPGSRGGGSVVANCRVYMRTGSPKTYVTCIYVGHHTVQKTPNVIRDCYCEGQNAAAADRAHAAFAANENTIVQNCVSQGFIRFFFCDTLDVGDVEITGCRGDVGKYVVDIGCDVRPDNPVVYRRRVRITNSTFSVDNPVDTYAVLLHTQEQNTVANPNPNFDKVNITDIDVHDCRVTCSLAQGNPAVADGIGFYTVAIQNARTQRVWVRNCTLPVGSKTAVGVYAPTPAGGVVFENLKYTPVTTFP